MSATLERLLNRLTRVYDITPGGPVPVLALRLSYPSGDMQWTIANDTLTTTVSDDGLELSIDLSQYTISTLAVYLASQPGYQVPYYDDQTVGDVSTLALVPGSGDIATSNGDHIYVASNLTWLHLAAVATELATAQATIEAMPDEMATTTADGEWLDLLGSYYAVPRLLGEQDVQYSPRIPAEVILPRQNNVAISAALIASTGQPATCTNAPVYGSPFPNFSGAIKFSGAPNFYNANARIIYNLFDVTIGYDLLGSLSPTDFLTAIRQQISRLRAAGTHLRNLTLTTSVMFDDVPPATDDMIEMLTVQTLRGTGSSSDFGICAGFYPTVLTPLSFSSNTGAGQLTTGIQLEGTGSSVDQVSFLLPPATGSSADSTVSVLTAGAGATLVGTSTSISLSFGAINTTVSLNGLTSSVSSAVGSLRTGAGLFGFSSSIGGDLGRAENLSTGINLAGTGASTDSASLNPSRLAVGIAASADTATGVLTTHVQLLGLTSSVDTVNANLSALSATAPPQVTGIVGTPSAGQLALTWNPSAGATSYYIYMATSATGPFTIAEQVFTNSANLTAGFLSSPLLSGNAASTDAATGTLGSVSPLLLPGPAVSRDTAIGILGANLLLPGLAISTDSAIAALLTASPPGPVSNITVGTIGKNSITFSWTAPTTGAPVTSYLIGQSTSANGGFQTVGNSLTTSFTAGGPSATTFYFQITPIGGGLSGQAVVSGGFSTADPAPLAVTNIQAGNITSTTMDVTWNASPGTDPSYSYAVALGTAALGPFTSLNSVLSREYLLVNGIDNAIVTPSTTYYFQITPFDHDQVRGQAAVSPGFTTAATPTPTPTILTHFPLNVQAFGPSYTVIPAPIVFFSATFTVPNAPSNPSANHSISLWIALQNNTQGILQPVLFWDSIDGWVLTPTWEIGPTVITSSPLIPVAPGTVLTAVIKCTGTSGANYIYDVYFEGYSGSLITVTAPPCNIPVIALENEEYSITACNQIPQGNVVWSNIVIKTGTPGTAGTAMTPSWVSNLSTGQVLTCGLTLTIDSPSQVTFVMPNQS